MGRDSAYVKEVLSIWISNLKNMYQNKMFTTNAVGLSCFLQQALPLSSSLNHLPKCIMHELDATGNIQWEEEHLQFCYLYISSTYLVKIRVMLSFLLIEYLNVGKIWINK